MSGIVDRKSRSAGLRMHPAILFVANLFLCAYLERFLRDERGEHELSLFLFIQSSISIVTAVSIFMTRGREVLLKTDLFPVHPGGRMAFLLLTFFRDSSLLALWASSVIFFIVLFRSSVLLVLQTLVVYLSLTVFLMLLVSLAALKLHRSAQPFAGLTVMVLAALVGTVATSLIFRSLPVLSSVPVLSWAAQAILAARRLDNGSYALFTLMVLGSGLLLLLLGRRRA